MEEWESNGKQNKMACLIVNSLDFGGKQEGQQHRQHQQPQSQARQQAPQQQMRQQQPPQHGGQQFDTPPIDFDDD